MTSLGPELFYFTYFMVILQMLLADVKPVVSSLFSSFPGLLFHILTFPSPFYNLFFFITCQS